MFLYLENLSSCSGNKPECSSLDSVNRGESRGLTLSFYSPIMFCFTIPANPEGHEPPRIHLTKHRESSLLMLICRISFRRLFYFFQPSSFSQSYFKCSLDELIVMDLLQCSTLHKHQKRNSAWQSLQCLPWHFPGSLFCQFWASFTSPQILKAILKPTSAKALVSLKTDQKLECLAGCHSQNLPGGCHSMELPALVIELQDSSSWRMWRMFDIQQQQGLQGSYTGTTGSSRLFPLPRN